MRKQLIAIGLLVLVLVLIFIFIKRGTGTAGDTYKSDKYGYSVSAPEGYSFDENSDEKVSIPGKVEIAVVRGLQADHLNFESFLRGELSNACAADGTSISIACDSITAAESFTAASGIAGGEVYLNRIHNDLEANASTTSNFGPIYLFSLPQNELRDEPSFLVLIVRPPTEVSSENIDEELIRYVANSLTFTQTNEEDR